MAFRKYVLPNSVFNNHYYMDFPLLYNLSTVDITTKGLNLFHMSWGCWIEGFCCVKVCILYENQSFMSGFDEKWLPFWNPQKIICHATQAPLGISCQYLAIIFPNMFVMMYNSQIGHWCVGIMIIELLVTWNYPYPQNAIIHEISKIRVMHYFNSWNENCDRGFHFVWLPIIIKKILGDNFGPHIALEIQDGHHDT